MTSLGMRRKVIFLVSIMTALGAIPINAGATGWYLMMPPSIADVKAPLHRWRRVAVFDSAIECEADKAREANKTEQFLLESHSGSLTSSQLEDYETRTASEYLRLTMEALCVSTDDPRIIAPHK
jgi:hypothetical protein